MTGLKNMIIGIDGNEANVEKKVGIGEYSYELLKQFVNLKSPHFVPLSGTSRGRQISNLKFIVYLKDKPREDLPRENENWRYRVVGPKKFWTQFALPFDLYFNKSRPDVFFTPSHYAPRFSPVPTVISIMDLSYIQYPALFRKSDLYQLKNWTAYSVKKASKVFTISKASKDDIIRVYKVPEDKVVVTYPGIKMESSKFKVQSSKSIKDKYGIKGDFILFVGTLQPRKNIVRLIEAFSKVILERSDRIPWRKEDSIGRFAPSRMTDFLSLVVIGKKGWMYEEILEAPKKFGVEDSVKFLDFVPDEDLPSFYKNAICFVLPSLYEGFGLPILEAMKYGCPVITSNVSSLPEAGGDAALYVDSLNVDDIKKNLESIIQSSELRNRLIKKGYEQVRKFSWEKTAREVLRVLEEVSSR